MTQTLIPHIDLTPLLGGAGGDDPAHADSVAAIVDAACHSGFMTVGIAPGQLDLPDDIHARLLRFFELDAAAKHRLARHKFEPANGNVYRGYFPPQNQDPTWKEGIDLGADVAHPERADAASGDPLREPTRPSPPPCLLHPPRFVKETSRRQRPCRAGRTMSPPITRRWNPWAA
ncbi:2-oxoglutarate and iron-dependent oxygenase domain-containing protein [Chromohalobacter japonicus]|uniref:2-oxoglutarate and iron-dependent oxygenase domain-containing protein n=1 Tax=Chromohalobacter japonicus TaxID=223900 RepID=UPI000A6B9A60|nr:2-oxoglutarate and iron-dependent oxygenase domain-containing protein [Chromohalobacter japonicus]